MELYIAEENNQTWYRKTPFFNWLYEKYCNIPESQARVEKVTLYPISQKA